MNSLPEHIIIRGARPTDAAALERLAALDSRHVPSGELLVAESDGELRAALSVEDGAYIADPFQRTAGLIALLDMRAAGLELRRRARHGRPRLALRAA